MSKTKEELNKIKEEVEALNEKCRELTEEELEQVVGGSNISTMLKGKVAGVQITSGGQPGAEMTIRVRGTRSITGSNEPLYIVD